MPEKCKLFYKSAAVIASLLLAGVQSGHAQELYPLHEPASTLGKNTLGIRLFSETYNEINQLRNMSAFRIMYGVTPKLTVMGTAIASNHHGKKFPQDYPFHNTPERGAKYPFRFNGGHLYAKYRFLTMDKKNTHFRMAVYGEGTYVNTSHHEAEPNLMMGDTKGIGAGFIATYLYKKMAASLTAGYIHPFAHTGPSPDVSAGIDDIYVRTQYGKCLTYGLSFGYLVFPKTYNSYRQTNFNVYLELHGKRYQDALVTLLLNTPSEYVLNPLRYPDALRRGGYLDISPGIQAIIHSNLRIDFSTTFPLLGFSWARLYPVFTVGLQYYFYL